MEDIGRWGLGINDGGNSRWPRQETLTLLEIRSRLDCNFKEANQKGPLWDQVSRIMEEEHGYHRSGKKCREKFENLYKYYKKTKEGKAGRQDGKNYRFFRQLEALYGDQTKPNSSIQQTILDPQESQNQNLQCKVPSDQSLSFSYVSEFDTLSSDNELHSMEKPKKKSWKAKVKGYVELRMKKMMETQEEWMERILKTVEEREQERVLREEEWRREEKERMEKEHEFWAKERAWFEARDVELMDVLNKISGKGVKQEIEEKMVNLGYEGNAIECREKWENLFLRRSNNGFDEGVQENLHVGVETMDGGESNWERYCGLKMLSKGKNHL